ncbi:hypothetical protein Y032_0010g1114 [Ancylostoma ceylanicum]|uniref:Uncharacterized protein n=1 Tax=Ancylostoma ceylanicum TaxID=53326 RepID=A0A016VGC8_9BILA|nr:hypothetical protein Y032_0010g1114 [Ancylostoma ceylanicum]
MQCYAVPYGIVWPTDARSRRCCAAHRCPIAAVLYGPKMPDRGGAVQTTDARSQWCCAARARPTSAPRCQWSGEGIYITETAE